MYGIPDRLKALSAAEEQVLLALWDCKPPVSRRDIGARLAEKGWAAATVLNFLYRLEEKGWVTCAKEQNHNLYVPTVTRRAYGVYTMRQRLDTVFWRRPRTGRAGAGERERLLSERAGTGHRRAERKARRSRRI